MAAVSASLRRLVYERANGGCEYCLIHDDDTYVPHEIDHIIATKHGGETTAENLCFCCFDCNRHKGSDLTSIDPETQRITPLFNPRLDRWRDHFRLAGSQIEGLTPTGRTTARLFQMNTQERQLERSALIALGRYHV
jgi:hypothetical protein